MTARLLRIPAADYHAERLGQPADTPPMLSASIARKLIAQSPYHAWLAHPKLGGVREDASREMERGTLIHAMVLGTAADDIVSIPHDDYRTKAAQAARDAARDAGKVPILEREWADVRKSAEAITEALGEQGINVGADWPGEHEAVVTWTEETSQGVIHCRGMMDYLSLGSGYILDLKTTHNAHPDAIARTCWDYGYDIQAAAYCSAYRHLRPEMAGRERFEWAFIEELPRGSPRRVIVTVARPSGEMREAGRIRWAKACEQWAACLATGVWPGYATGVASISPPAWAMREMCEEPTTIIQGVLT